MLLNKDKNNTIYPEFINITAFSFIQVPNFSKLLCKQVLQKASERTLAWQTQDTAYQQPGFEDPLVEWSYFLNYSKKV